MKLDPECPPAPHNVYSRMHTCNGRFRTASKIEVGVESYSEATVSKYIRRSGTTLRAVVRGGVEWGVVGVEFTPGQPVEKNRACRVTQGSRVV